MTRLTTRTTAISIATAIAVAVLLIPMVGLAAPASASCAPPLPIGQALDEASYVFVGTVTALRSDDRYATLDVEEVWRGDLAATVEVNGGPSPADVGAAEADGLSISTSVDRTYTLDQRYLVVSSGMEAGVLADNACSATTEYTDDFDQFRPVDSYVPTAAPTDTSVEESEDSLSLWWLLTGGSVLIVGLVFLVARRRP